MKTLIYNHLNEKGINLQILEENEIRTIYSFRVNLKNGTCDTLIEIINDPGKVITSTYLSVKIPEEHRNKVSEFITRVNDLLSIGNFNLDLNNGNLCFKTSFLYNEIYNGYTDLFHEYLYLTFNMVDIYIPAIMSVIYSNVSPEDAYNNIENIIKPELN